MRENPKSQENIIEYLDQDNRDSNILNDQELEAVNGGFSPDSRNVYKHDVPADVF